MTVPPLRAAATPAATSAAAPRTVTPLWTERFEGERLDALA